MSASWRILRWNATHGIIDCIAIVGVYAYVYVYVYAYMYVYVRVSDCLSACV